MDSIKSIQANYWKQGQIKILADVVIFCIYYIIVKNLVPTALCLLLTLSAACSDGDDSNMLLAVPMGLTIRSVGDQKINLAWEAVSGNGITYKVYRDNTVIAMNVADTTYTDNGADLMNDTGYSYQVAAVNSAGIESPKSSAVVGTPTLRITPTRPLVPFSLMLNVWSTERTLAPGDSNVFSVHLAARLYRIVVSPVGPSITLVDATEREVPQNDGSYQIAAAGDYSIKIANAGTNSVNYALLMRYDLCSAGTSTDCLVAPGIGYIRCLETPGDEDWYRITLKEHHTYDINVTLGDTPQCSVPGSGFSGLIGITEAEAATLHLALKSADGVELRRSSTSTFESATLNLSGIAVETTGIHYISISVENSINKTGEYTFFINKTAIPITEGSDCPGDASTTCTTDISRIYSGDLSIGIDTADWIQVSVSEAGSYTVGVKASPGDLKFMDVRLVAFGGSGEFVLQRLRSGKIYRSTITLTPGEYTLRITNESGSGSYRAAFVSSGP